MSIEEAAELARRSIYHATFRDGASGGVASGTLSLDFYFLFHLGFIFIFLYLYGWFENIGVVVEVYHVGPTGWTKLSGDDVGELHYSYYPVEPAIVEQEMTEAVAAWVGNLLLKKC